jgi:hypothetical protein
MPISSSQPVMNSAYGFEYSDSDRIAYRSTMFSPSCSRIPSPFESA